MWNEHQAFQWTNILLGFILGVIVTFYIIKGHEYMKKYFFIAKDLFRILKSKAKNHNENSTKAKN